ncbi:MAG: tetratricopeptide repeat protein [Flavobacterium sp.]|nr:tetratricopeptide repeat protein [Flavobacterium sp.]
MKIKLLLLFIVCTFAAYSQKAESLVAQLPQAANDIERADLLNSIADAYKTSNPSLVKSYADKALALSNKIGYAAAKGNALLNLGNAAILSGNYPAALKHFTDAAHIFENEDQTDISRNGLFRAYGSIGIVFSEQSNYAKALHFHLKAVKIAEQLRDDQKLSRVYNNVGIVYQALSEDFKALDYFLKAHRLMQNTDDPTIGITETNIGNIYLRRSDYPKADEYYRKALQSFKKYKNPRGSGELYNNIGLYYFERNKSELALQNWNNALSEFNSVGDKFGAADTHLHLASYHFKARQTDLATQYAREVLNVAKELGVLEQQVLALKILSDIYAQTGEPALALDHFKMYSIAKDSLVNQVNIRKSVQSELNYEFEKRDAIQKQESEKRELLFRESEKRHRLQMAAAGIVLLLIFGIIMLVYSRRNLKKNLTLQKNLAEYEQKALHLQMNPHFVFNCLGSISSFIVQNGTDQALKYLSKFSKLMRLTLEYSKEPLIPVDKEIESLQNYIELEQLRFDQVFDFTISKSADIEDDMALPPLLLQPFVENAIIHGLVPKSERGQIDIKFSLSGDSLICEIKDNGIGFEKSQELKKSLVNVHKSMALDITKKRLQMLGNKSGSAMVEINEQRDDNDNVKGTMVVVTLPVQYISNENSSND